MYKVPQLVDQVWQLLRSPLGVLLDNVVHALTVVVGSPRATSDDDITYCVMAGTHRASTSLPTTLSSVLSLFLCR